jgi:hypothetical protein
MSVAGEGVHRHHNPDHDDGDEREESEARCQSPPFGIEPTRVFNTSNDEEDEPCEIELPTTNGSIMMSSSQERTRGLHQNPLQYPGGVARPLTPTVMHGGPPPGAIPSTVPCPATADRPPATSPLSQASSAKLQPPHHPRSQQAIESSVVTAFSYHPVSD